MEFRKLKLGKTVFGSGGYEFNDAEINTGGYHQINDLSNYLRERGLTPGDIQFSEGGGFKLGG